MTAWMSGITQTSRASLLVAALAATASSWVGEGGQAPAAENLGPLMKDAVSRVVRERAGSVVLLHSTERRLVEAPSSWFVPPVREALGSGIVIDNDGFILTNAHVVREAGQLHVRRPDGEDVETTVIGMDSDSDLALVRVSDAAGLVPAPLRRFRRHRRGQLRDRDRESPRPASHGDRRCAQCQGTRLRDGRPRVSPDRCGRESRQ